MLSFIVELGSKQWCILCVALLVALGTGVSVGVPLALRSGSSLQERLGTANTILAQVPLIDGYVIILPLSFSLSMHCTIACCALLQFVSKLSSL